ncbi:MAG: tetratricopeptide repeat protein [Leptospirillia bacterium]
MRPDTPTAWAATGLLFLLVGLGLYANALNNPFHYDDHHGIVDNHYLRDPGNIPRFFSVTDGKRYFAPSDPKARHYRPLLLTTYALNFATGGDDPRGFHLLHVVLHALGALLVALIGRRMGLAFFWAVGCGFLFLVHPLHTEVINYISARSSLLSGVFSLAAFYAFVRARQGENNRRIGWLGASLGLTVCAVLTKEVAVAVPLLFVLYDLIYPPERRLRWGIHGHGLSLLLLGGGVVVLFWQHYLQHAWNILTKGVGVRGFGDNLWLQMQVLMSYVKLTLLPTGLSIAHDFTGADRPNLLSGVCLLLLLGITVLAIRARKHTPLALLGWGFFLIILSPTTVLPLNTPLQEGRGYAAVAGLMLGLAALFQAGALRLRLDRRWAVALLVPALLFPATTVSRNPVWASDHALWSDAVAKSPGDFRAHANLGTAFHAENDLESAVAHYREAIALFPWEASVHADLGSALLTQGDMAGARASLDQAIKLYPRYAPAYFTLGILSEREGDTEAAETAYRKAIKLRRANKPARMNLGILLARQGRLDEAEKLMQQALELDPTDPQVYVNLMLLYRQMQNMPRALALYQRARANGAVTPELERLAPRSREPRP